MTYKTTKIEFLARVDALIPASLTAVADEIAELYPEFHVPSYADLVCAADSHAEIIDAVRQLSDNDVIAIITLPLADAIMNRADELTQSEADEIMTLVRKIDPTDSNIAAEIRDAIRDNHDVTI